MKISRSSFVYRVADTFGNPDDNLCSLARCFVFSALLSIGFSLVALFLVAGVFIVFGSAIGECLASLVTGYFDDDSIFRFFMFICLAVISLFSIFCYYCVSRGVDSSDAFHKVFPERKEKTEKQENVYWAMVKSFTGKFCVRVEYTWDKE
jgi:hypothetical protein